MVHIANLKLGLAQGYSAPQSVVKRVIEQMDTLSGGSPESSPFYSPAKRSTDATFQAAFTKAVIRYINPALMRYRDFLHNEYLPHAREGIAVSDLPNGAACYAAFLRANTTLSLTAAQLYTLGQETVAGYHADVLRLGKQAYGKDTFEDIVAAMEADPSNRFRSRDDLLARTQVMITAAHDRTAASLIDRMPTQKVKVESLAPFEEQTGVTSRMEGEPDPAKPEIFRINLGNWGTETVGEAEVTVAHEVWPGHGLQLATAAENAAQGHSSSVSSKDAYAES